MRRVERDLDECRRELVRWTRRRDTLIGRASRDGLTLREIGDLVGLSHTMVRKILAKNGAK